MTINSKFYPFHSFNEFKETCFDIETNEIQTLFQVVIGKEGFALKAPCQEQKNYSLFHYKNKKLKELESVTLHDDVNDQQTLDFFIRRLSIFISANFIKKSDPNKIIMKTFNENKTHNMNPESANETLENNWKISGNKKNFKSFLISKDSDFENKLVMYIFYVKNKTPYTFNREIDFSLEFDFINFLLIEGNKYLPLKAILKKNSLEQPINFTKKRLFPEIPVQALSSCKRFKYEDVAKDFENNILTIRKEELSLVFAKKLNNTWAVVYYDGAQVPKLVIKENKDQFKEIPLFKIDLNIMYQLADTYGWAYRFNSPWNQKKP